MAAEFLRTLLVRTIPDKKQIEREARFADDGATQTKMLDDFDEQFEEQLLETDGEQAEVERGD
ncbi:MAG: hypothetical protein HC875_23225, partial [Anaerolineales bacterium]|nr:hypothetical protein [Anaerolineales bacterium]